MTRRGLRYSDVGPDRARSVWIGAALLALLAIAWILPQVALGGFGFAASLVVATAKASLVGWFYMELRDLDRATWVAASAGALLLAALAGLTCVDYLGRA